MPRKALLRIGERVGDAPRQRKAGQAVFIIPGELVGAAPKRHRLLVAVRVVAVRLVGAAHQLIMRVVAEALHLSAVDALGQAVAVLVVGEAERGRRIRAAAALARELVRPVVAERVRAAFALQFPKSSVQFVMPSATIFQYADNQQRDYFFVLKRADWTTIIKNTSESANRKIPKNSPFRVVIKDRQTGDIRKNTKINPRRPICICRLRVYRLSIAGRQSFQSSIPITAPTTNPKGIIQELSDPLYILFQHRFPI